MMSNVSCPCSNVSACSNFFAQRHVLCPRHHQSNSMFSNQSHPPLHRNTMSRSSCFSYLPHSSIFTLGQERSYDFTIARGTIAPDGYQKDVLLINGQFPGPTIEANWGDTITVTVNNDITGPEEGTSFHWHGLLQSHTPWEDGVPAVSQCPIAPGKSLTYSFKADLYGTSWYHSHYSAQYAGGLIGPMIIHGPNTATYDIDLGPVLLTDYYHLMYYDIVEQVMGTNLSLIAPKSVNNLINGKMDYNCSLVTDGTPCTDDAGLSKFQFTTGKKHRLRLINAGAEGIQKFSIDNHTMTVIANDFVPIEPYETDIVTLSVNNPPYNPLELSLTPGLDWPAHRRNSRGQRQRLIRLLDALHHLQLFPNNPTRRSSNNLLPLSLHQLQTQHHRLGRHYVSMRQ